MGPADAMALTFEEGTKVPLGDSWRYRAVPLAMGRAPRAPWEPISGLTTLYNAMIAPIGPYGLRAAAWYQGETNADEPAGYEKLLGGLMASWRSQFGADLPFLVVQLPNFGAVPTKPVEANWSEIREAQRRAVAADAHAGLVVTIDIGERGDMHPVNKRDVGRRCARAARRVVYGETVAPSGPVPLSARRDGVRDRGDVRRRRGQPRELQLRARPSGSSCAAPARARAGSSRPTSKAPRSCCRPTRPGRRTPTRVRFCWGPSPFCNLSDGSGLPVGPFEIPIN